jgi:hypothetical protein
MSLEVKEDKAANPVHVSLFGADRIIQHAEFLANLIDTVVIKPYDLDSPVRRGGRKSFPSLKKGE